ncbi:MAG: phosphoribosylamine--glycine ligase [Nanoarchaeota archaeon]
MAKVLIVGSGGREHALGWKLGQSKEVSNVLYAPGNGGTEEGKGRNIHIDIRRENFQDLVELIRSEKIDLCVVGPEAPLVDGIVDYFNSQGLDRIFSPKKAAAKLESDKFFSYDLMNALNILQADSIKCYTIEEAVMAIKERATSDGIVIKSRGLTRGKGVLVCDSKKQALEEITSHVEKYGREVLISERLFGEEFSIFGISDGDKVLPLEISLQDHKRLLDGDKGPNTGGMGAYGPTSIMPNWRIREVTEKVMTPTVQRMKETGAEFIGFLYAGMIMTREGPKVLEFNCRLGDPEWPPTAPLIKGDLCEVIYLALERKLEQVKLEYNQGAACCVVLASRGYPNEYEYKRGLQIEGIKEAEKIENVKVFHAGTKIEGRSIVTDGGRVLEVTAYSKEGINTAQKLAYEAASKIKVSGGFHYRKDIGNKELTRLIN